jgi:hypothetical protein
MKTSSMFLTIITVVAMMVGVTGCATTGRSVGYAYPQPCPLGGWGEEIIILRSLDATDTREQNRHQEKMAEIRARAARDEVRADRERERDQARAREQATREISRVVQTTQRNRAARQRDLIRTGSGLARDYLRYNPGQADTGGRR